MSNRLHFSDSLELPIDAAAARFVILGKGGAGKTNSDTVMIEEFIGAGVPVIVIDPLGNMWGLRSSADGESAGLPIAIFGGRHADVPLRADRGIYVADMLADGVSAVLDLSLMTRDEQHEFVADFLPRLLSRVRVNMHVAIEEAETFAPERATSKPHGRVRSATTVFARTARNYGVGWTFSTQRPQILAKDVIDTSTAFLAMKMTGELAQEAIGAEVRSRAGKTLAASIITELPRFSRGEAWLIPDADWLGDQQGDVPPEPLRFRFRWRKTFDSARPPKVGEERRDPRVLAAVDIARLRAEMADEVSVDTADVDALRARIKMLEGASTAGKQEGVPEQEVARRVAAAIEAERATCVRDLERLTVPLAKIRDLAMAALGEGFAAMTQDAAEPTPPPNVDHRPAAKTAVATPSAGLSTAEQRVLDAVAWWRAATVDMPSRHQVAFVASYTVNGHFNNLVGSLRGKGLLEYPSPNCLGLTPAGVKAARLPDSKPTRADLIDRVLAVLKGEPQRRIFGVLANRSTPITRERLATSAGYTVNGHFNNIVGALNSIGIADYPSKGHVGLSPIFKELP